jgi:hypothetical protein
MDAGADLYWLIDVLAWNTMQGKVGAVNRVAAGLEEIEPPALELIPNV